MPRNKTCERSGSFRLASPPTSWADWAKAAVAPELRMAIAAATVLITIDVWANWQPQDTAFASQVRIGFLRYENYFGTITCLGTATRRTAPTRRSYLRAPGSALPEFRTRFHYTA